MGWFRDGAAKRWRLAHVLVGVLAFSVVAGTTGCWNSTSSSSEEARKKLEELKKKKKPKPPFERLQVITEPHERAVGQPPPTNKDEVAKGEPDKVEEDEFGNPDAGLVRGYLKPGHWTGVLLTTTANQDDFVGELTSTPLDSSQNPIDFPNSAFRLATSRPVALAKEQPKTLETMFFAPESTSSPKIRKATQMHNQLRDRRRGTVEWSPQPEILQHMPSYQYYLYVLARDENRYRYFKVLDSVNPPLTIPLVITADQYYYRVLTPRPEAPLALPNRALAWTSIAYMVWDDVLPAVLSAQQQQAMLDWLHWGGGLIISGPRTLDSMRGTFLDPYLPAMAVETTEIGEASLAELNEHWTLRDAQGARLPLAAVKPWSGIKLEKHPAAEFIPGTGKLVVERRVGRGRIVVTAFHLNERELLDWRSFDNFVNACLLRRLPRRFDSQRQQFDFVGSAGIPVVDSFDARLTTPLRYFTRDTDRNRRNESSEQDPSSIRRPQQPAANSFQSQPVYDEQWQQEAYLEEAKGKGGAAGWDDFNEAGMLARDTLREAAGISVPNRRFVVWMVGTYLVIIVPLNWLVFRAVGRVELAWLAVPVVAVGWGVAVVWLAQLDIGFARAENEVAVLEVQNGYARGHLTRYMALYSSLSTTYDVHFDDPSALAQPFALDRAVLPGQSHSTVMLRSGADQQLTDFGVSSNSTGMIHSEQMVNLNGALVWRQSSDGPPTLENGTRLKFSGVMIVRRGPPGEVPAEEPIVVAPGDKADSNKDNDKGKDKKPPPPADAAWIGELAPGDVIEVVLKPLGEVRAEIERGRAEAPVTANSRPAGTLSLTRLVELAEDPWLLRPGDIRLVGWYDQGLPGAHASPSAAQARRATLVVAHLEFVDTPPEPDEGLRNVPLPTEP